MAVVIHDDFWQAAEAMPEQQRAPFIYALCRYAFSGEEPEGGQPWYPTFLVVRGRLDMGGERSARARKMAEARWGSRAQSSDDAQASCTDDAQASCTDDAQASDGDDAEKEKEKEKENKPLKPPYAEIVHRLNEACGTQYRPQSRKTRDLIRARWAEGYRLDDFAAVCETMAAEWGSDPKMRAYLRPETLFGPKFEGYLNRAPREGADYGRYD